MKKIKTLKDLVKDCIDQHEINKKKEKEVVKKDIKDEFNENEKLKIIRRILDFNLSRFKVVGRKTKSVKILKMIDAAIVDFENTIKYIDGDLDLRYIDEEIETGES